MSQAVSKTSPVSKSLALSVCQSHGLVGLRRFSVFAARDSIHRTIFLQWTGSEMFRVVPISKPDCVPGIFFFAFYLNYVGIGQAQYWYSNVFNLFSVFQRMHFPLCWRPSSKSQQEWDLRFDLSLLLLLVELAKSIFESIWPTEINVTAMAQLAAIISLRTG